MFRNGARCPAALSDWVPALLAILAITFVAAASGCGTNAHGTDACRKIEQARCRRAPDCPDMGMTPALVSECQVFARDNCQHGLGVADPPGADVDNCVGAILRSETTCELVRAPEAIPECNFLQQIAPSDAAAEPAPAEDSQADSGDESPKDATTDSAG